jgi:hypothetical protein
MGGGEEDDARTGITQMSFHDLKWIQLIMNIEEWRNFENTAMIFPCSIE